MSYHMAKPPLMLIDCPVMWAAAELHRQVMSPATSASEAAQLPFPEPLSRLTRPGVFPFPACREYSSKPACYQ
jgi:hypothetical protein